MGFIYIVDSDMYIPAIPAGMCHFHTKKAQNQTYPVIQTVFKISSAGKEVFY